MCASRGRPQLLVRMVDSVRRTSTKADVVVYLDDDDADTYSVDVPTIVGPRLGQCGSLNALYDKFGAGYVAAGAATDDCEFRTLGWDDWVISKTQAFRGQVGAIGPYCEAADRM